MTILSSMCSSCAAFAAHRFHIQATHKTSCNTPSPHPLNLLYALRESRRNTQHALQLLSIMTHGLELRLKINNGSQTNGMTDSRQKTAAKGETNGVG